MKYCDIYLVLLLTALHVFVMNENLNRIVVFFYVADERFKTEHPILEKGITPFKMFHLRSFRRTPGLLGPFMVSGLLCGSLCTVIVATHSLHIDDRYICAAYH